MNLAFLCPLVAINIFVKFNGFSSSSLVNHDSVQEEDITFEQTLPHFLRLVPHARAVLEVEGQVGLGYRVLGLFSIHNQWRGAPHMGGDLHLKIGMNTKFTFQSIVARFVFFNDCRTCCGQALWQQSTRPSYDSDVAPLCAIKLDQQLQPPIIYSSVITPKYHLCTIRR